MNWAVNVGVIIFFALLFAGMLRRIARRKEGKLTHLLLDLAVVVFIFCMPFVFYYVNNVILKGDARLAVETRMKEMASEGFYPSRHFLILEKPHTSIYGPVLSHKDPAIRRMSADMIGDSGTTDGNTTEKLRRMTTTDEDPAVRKAAADAYENIKAVLRDMSGFEPLPRIVEDMKKQAEDAYRTFQAFMTSAGRDFEIGEDLIAIYIAKEIKTGTGKRQISRAQYAPFRDYYGHLEEPGMPGISVFGEDLMIVFWPLAGPDQLKVRHLVVETLIDRFYSEPYAKMCERPNYWVIQGMASYFEKSEFRHGRAVFSPDTNEHRVRAAMQVASGKAKDFAEFVTLNRDEYLDDFAQNNNQAAAMVWFFLEGDERKYRDTFMAYFDLTFRRGRNAGLLEEIFAADNFDVKQVEGAWIEAMLDIAEAD